MPYSLENFYTSLNLREVKEYRSWEHASDAIDQFHGAIGDEPIHSLKAYHDFIIPAAMGSHPFFSLERVEKWVKPAPYATFKVHVYTETESNTGNARQTVTPTRRLVKEEKSIGLGWYMEFSSPSLISCKDDDDEIMARMDAASKSGNIKDHNNTVFEREHRQLQC
ncbi:hypothetical protein M422DRAFT_245644 [Sphaerobolus stellatus SS14]|nr:hypothetical protein M422DRAFT_245644 [Sphaerobolus stellatus SS14]